MLSGGVQPLATDNNILGETIHQIQHFINDDYDPIDKKTIRVWNRGMDDGARGTSVAQRDLRSAHISRVGSPAALPGKALPSTG